MENQTKCWVVSVCIPLIIIVTRGSCKEHELLLYEQRFAITSKFLEIVDSSNYQLFEKKKVR